MLTTRNTQSLTDFRQNATATLDRINAKTTAEILTVTGEARAVLLSPAAYDELTRDAMLFRDVTLMRQAIKQIDNGEQTNSGDFFDDLRSQLLVMKDQREVGK
ncbi:MAG: type II toxin-antitoxin system Phd/YefM family antitoxin [Burkholderiales bacterium]|nr:type II toxin-antitoxin system Phd/YefM family antitoxin [Phycisphaerae bacterium]